MLASVCIGERSSLIDRQSIIVILTEVGSAVFLEALVGLVDPDITHFKKRCTSVTQSPTDPGQLVVHFSDGTSHETDIVLGADGIRSAVRNYVVADGAEKVVFGNTVAYRGLIPHAALKAAGFNVQLADRPACFVGPDKVRETTAPATSRYFGYPF